jgi:hypothetical protein
MALAQIRYAALHAAKQVAHQVDRATPDFEISFAQKLLQGQANDFRPSASHVSCNLVEFGGQIGRHSKGQLAFHYYTPPFRLHLNVVLCSAFVKAGVVTGDYPVFEC